MPPRSFTVHAVEDNENKIAALLTEALPTAMVSVKDISKERGILAATEALPTTMVSVKDISKVETYLQQLRLS